MSKTAVTLSNAPKPAGPYSHGVVANGFLFTAGFTAHDPATGLVVEGGAVEQTRQSLRNIGAVLAAHDLTFDDVVKVTAHLADLADFADFNAAYAEFFTEPYPVRTTVGSRLANVLVEIDVVAAIPAPPVE